MRPPASTGVPHQRSHIYLTGPAKVMQAVALIIKT
jgi:hypothetical protein